MKAVFHLATCNTCQRILKEWKLPTEVVLREIKSEPMTAAEVDHLASLAGSYEALFSRRARKFRGMGLHERELSEPDYRRYLLEDYTFLKRPVLVWENQIYVGNSPKIVAAAGEFLKAL
ncbi:MAG: ArsC/Spx/MgsR family protein [Bacteroidota bacterium]